MSTRAAVRAALVTLWTPLFPNALVLRGSRTLVTRSELIVVGDTSGTTTQATAGPSRQMEEDYTITCVISVTWNATPDQQGAVEDRAAAMFDQAEYAVRSYSDLTLGVPGVLWVVVSGDFQESNADAADAQGQVNAQIAFPVLVKARYRLSV